MTRSLGSLGTPHDPIDATFEYFGVIIRVHPEAGDLELMEFLMDASEIDAVDQMRAMASISRYLKGLVHPDDWVTFWSTAKAHRQNLDDLMALGQKIVSEAAGFPTQQSDDSSGGQPTTKQKSKGGSSSQDTKANASRAQEVQRALASVPDRPDLKEFFVMAEEARLAVG